MDLIDLRTVRSPDEMSPLFRGLLSPVLLPLSGIYWAIMRVRRAVPAERTDVGIPAVSVGSLAVGGTGKTPLCMWIAERFRDMGRRVCILSRGYLRKRGSSPLVVSDGSNVLVDVEEAGDEPFMMAKRLDEVGVIVGKNRLESALLAKEDLHADLLVLDDGFQERRLKRDVDVLCFGESTLQKNTAPLPWGVFREGWSAVGPEDLVVVRLDEEGSPASSDVPFRLRRARLFYCARSKPALLDPDFREVPGDTGGRPVVLVSGIARPAAFEESCASTGADIRASIRFEDHHWYSKGDAATVAKIMDRCGARHLMTTEKDIWKLPAGLRRNSLILTTGLVFLDDDAFLEALKANLGLTV
jgi:tetraacyldisaccharide 4'-kinase